MAERSPDIVPGKPLNGGKRRILPTNRIAFPKQLDVLRAYAAASNEGEHGVTNEAVSNIVGLSASTVSLANPFFADIGLIERREGGYAPAAEVVSFARSYQWDPDFAGSELSPRLRESWFGEALMPRLQFGPLDVDAALRELGKAANAEPKYRNQLRTLLDYLETGQLIAREGNQLLADQDAPASKEKTDAAPPESDKPTSQADAPQVAHVPGGPLPLLIQGLLQELPRGGTWTREKANAWLDLAKLTLEMVYEFEDSPNPARSRGEDGAQGSSRD